MYSLDYVALTRSSLTALLCVVFHVRRLTAVQPATTALRCHDTRSRLSSSSECSFGTSCFLKVSAPDPLSLFYTQVHIPIPRPFYAVTAMNRHLLPVCNHPISFSLIGLATVRLAESNPNITIGLIPRRRLLTRPPLSLTAVNFSGLPSAFPERLFCRWPA